MLSLFEMQYGPGEEYAGAVRLQAALDIRIIVWIL